MQTITVARLLEVRSSFSVVFSVLFNWNLELSLRFAFIFFLISQLNLISGGKFVIKGNVCTAKPVYLSGPHIKSYILCLSRRIAQYVWKVSNHIFRKIMFSKINVSIPILRGYFLCVKRFQPIITAANNSQLKKTLH